MAEDTLVKRVIFTLLVIVAGSIPAPAKYSGGSGDPNDPYKIANVADFTQLTQDPNNWNKAFILTADINLTGLTFTKAPIAPDTNTTTSGFQGTPFTGIFDGNSHIISKLTITASTKDYISLFGYVGSGSQIHNLGVEDVNITGRYYVGGLVGYNYSSLTSCYATGSVSGSSNSQYIGGLGGYNGGIIRYCYSTGSVSGVSGSEYVGGLVGLNDSGSLTSCYATGAVSGFSGSSYCVGGLVGRNVSGSLTSCYATGSVTGGYDFVGGLVGNNSGSLTSCFATGAVSGNYDVGGLVGSNSYGPLTACFWDMETSGQSKSAGGGRGLTTSQMKSISIYQNACWADKGWVINDGLDYPHLAWENTGGVPIPQPQPVPLLGSGSEQAPYQIWTADDFVLLSWNVDILDKHLALMTNLDLSGIVLYPIGDLSPFTGVFDGNDNIISNADINQPGSDYVGLFGYVGSGGQIRNLGVEDVNINGSAYVGGLVGLIDSGTLTSCYATGAVSGTYSVGGLVGDSNGVTLTDCYATGSVTGTSDSVGGLVGYNNYVKSSRFENCYATGSVSGNSWVGGLLGCNYSTLTDCYATGSVTGTGTYIGGLVGENDNYGSLTSCYATGSVTGNNHDVGGLVGLFDSGTLTSCYATGSVTGTGYCVGGLVGENLIGTLTGCYATGSVTGTGHDYYFVGGLVGSNGGGSLTSCYSTGAVSGYNAVGGLVGQNYSGSLTSCYATGSVKGKSRVGGLVGYNSSGSLTACFWDINTSGQTISAGGTGMTTAQMKQQASFVGWDFVWETINGTEDIWAICENVSYPKLAWQFVAGDSDNDKDVNFIDFAAMGNKWMQADSNLYCGGSDLTGDGLVNWKDLAALAENWLQGL